ncbi:hypothetical protein CZ787_07645 [Halomonas citrativorans]|uniref:Uncharacterized protein n=1 Tax=Halomonas citrativorans TaxID=2742612 RepID=A0A1R4HXG6_9GAMM|nr:hypothetical protein CZ787_07645 [Halomonas citrativorans]
MLLLNTGIGNEKRQQGKQILLNLLTNGELSPTLNQVNANRT